MNKNKSSHINVFHFALKISRLEFTGGKKE